MLPVGSARPRPPWKPKPRPPPRRRKARAEGGKKSDRAPAPPKEEPDGKAQRNFTDPQSRIMKTKDDYIQGYNAQAAVDGGHQIIVAQTLSNCSSDQQQMAPLLDAIKAAFGCNPDEVLADAGYCSKANLRTIRKRRRINGYIATGRQKHGTRSATAMLCREGYNAANIIFGLFRCGLASDCRPVGSTQYPL